MSLEDDDTSNLLEFTPISSNQHVKKAIQNSAIATVDSFINASLKTLIKQQAAMYSNTDKLTNTFCNQLTNFTSILTHNVNVEQTLRGSSSTSSQEQSLVVKTRHIETRKRHHHEVSSTEDSDDSDGNDMPILKSPKLDSHHSCVQSAAPAHRDNDKVSIPDEEEMNRNLKVLQWESDNNNSHKDGIDDGEDDFKELSQELNKEEGLGEPVQQTLSNILQTFWRNLHSYEKMKDNMKIYARSEKCSSLVVKKCNKEIWLAYLTFRDKANGLRFQRIQTAVLKGTIAITQVTSDLVKLKNNRELTAKDIRKSIIPVIRT